MRAEARNLLALIEAASPDQLPELLGELRMLEVTAERRLYAAPSAEAGAVEWLNVEEAARRINMSQDYCYRNSKKLGAVRIGRAIRFNSRGLELAMKRAAR